MADQLMHDSTALCIHTSGRGAAVALVCLVLRTLILLLYNQFGTRYHWGKSNGSVSQALSMPLCPNRRSPKQETFRRDQRSTIHVRFVDLLSLPIQSLHTWLKNPIISPQQRHSILPHPPPVPGSGQPKPLLIKKTVRKKNQWSVQTDFGQYVIEFDEQREDDKQETMEQGRTIGERMNRSYLLSISSHFQNRSEAFKIPLLMSGSALRVPQSYLLSISCHFQNRSEAFKPLQGIHMIEGISHLARNLGLDFERVSITTD